MPRERMRDRDEGQGWGGGVTTQKRGHHASAPPAGAGRELPVGRGSLAPPRVGESRHRQQRSPAPHGQARGAGSVTPDTPVHGQLRAMRRSPPVLHGHTVLQRGPGRSDGRRRKEGRRREGGRREGGREKCRLLPTPAGRTGHQSLQAPLWQLAQGGFARLQKCLWKAPEAEADGRGGLRMFWVLPRGTAVCTSGQALGTPLHGASFAYTSLAREIYSSRGVLRPYISLPLVSSQLPHQQAVTYFHTFILPSSSTGFMSLQTACTDAVG